jgi:hypothetical protein
MKMGFFILFSINKYFEFILLKFKLLAKMLKKYFIVYQIGVKIKALYTFVL